MKKNKELKLITTATIIALVWMGLFYLIFSFVLWEINPEYWSLTPRYFLAMLGAIGGIIMGIIYCIIGTIK